MKNLIFNKDNCDDLQATCQKIVNLLDENENGELMVVQKMFLGDLITEFINNPIICKSGIL